MKSCRHKSSSLSLRSSSSSSSVATIASLQTKKKVKTYLKLIDLYKNHECLWNECDKEFFNFKLREQIWESIARKMKRDSDPNSWKYVIHKLRYNVQREKIHEQVARFNNTMNTLRPKLAYSDKLQFLNHMFDRKRVTDAESLHTTSTQNLVAHVSGSIASGERLQPQESLNARYRHLRRPKNKNSRPLQASKLKALESLRGSQSSNLILTPEAFRKVNRIISDYTWTSKK